MFKREIKVNYKNFLIWILILISIFFVVFLVYPSIISDKNIGMIDDMMKLFPEEILKAFNMDISSMNSAYGWLKSEGFVFILLIVGCYSAMLGSNIVLKEENDKTIEYLNSRPIKRSSIVLNKALVGFIYLIAMVVIIGIFNYFGLLLSGDFDKQQYILLSITPIFSSIVLFFLCMFLSTFTRKTRKMVGISFGMVFFSYLMQMLSLISNKVKFLEFFSVYTLADVRNVILNTSINPVMVIISIILSMICLLLTIYRYNKKEFV